jgi:hypothetical protein
MKINGRVAPAFQMLLGGQLSGNNVEFARPVLKVVSSRLPAVLTAFLEEFESNRVEGETVAGFIRRIGLDTITTTLERVASDFNTGSPELFRDWGGHSLFALNVKQGECAGVDVDFTDALFARAEILLAQAEAYRRNGRHSESVYSDYSGVIQAAKALLTTRGIHATSYHQILTECGRILENGHASDGGGGFRKRVELFKNSIPDAAGASEYAAFARTAVDQIRVLSKAGASSAA